jgi:quercetin dioxygenase-like cupin family protein
MDMKMTNSTAPQMMNAPHVTPVDQDTQHDPPPGEESMVVDIQRLSAAAVGNGAQWASERDDLDMTLLSWTAGQEVAPHVNTEVDVLLIVLAGTATLSVAAHTYGVGAGEMVLIPKGAERAIRCRAERVSYLSIHRRRRLWPTVGRPETFPRLMHTMEGQP